MEKNIEITLNNSLSYLFYSYLNKFLERFQTKKLAMNTTALFHAVSAVLLFGNYICNKNVNIMTLRMNTSGYFLFDLLYLLKNRKINLLTSMYLYHHICGIYLLSHDPTKFDWISVIFWAELSNIPSYFVYYSMKMDKLNNLTKSSISTKRLKDLQLLVYGIIRMGVLTKLTIKEYMIRDEKFALYLNTPTYFMGVLWTITLFLNRNK